MSGLPANFGIVTLGVADVARAAAFYAALGWERAGASSEEIVWFRTSGSYVGLFERSCLAEDAAVPNTPAGGFTGITLAVNVDSPDAVDAGLAGAVAAGGSVVKPGTKAEWGGYSGYFADPDGFLWEVAHNPHFPLSTEGQVRIP